MESSNLSVSEGRTHVLIVDDYVPDLDLAAESLNLYGGFVTYKATDAQTASGVLREKRPDIALVDLGLPDMDGFEWAKAIRSDPAFDYLALIMVTGHSELTQKVLALQKVADDYVIKPYDPAELVARIQAVLRRRGGVTRVLIEWKTLRIDEPGRRVWVAEQPVSLTPKEFELLVLLIKNRDVVIRRRDLVRAVWHQEYNRRCRSLDSHVWSLRSKLGALGQHVQTIESIGYRFSS